MSRSRFLAISSAFVALLAARDLRAQTTYYVEAATAVNVGVDGSTNMATLADLTVTGGSSNQNRAITNTTAPTGTARWRLREGAVDTRTGQEFLRAYTPAYSAATNIAANATAYADFYMNTTGTSLTAWAILYEYNDTTGIVGAPKGTASFVGNATITTRQTLNNVSFGNAVFTVASGNRLLVTYGFDMNNSRPAYLWGQAPSATPSGYQSFTGTESPAVSPPGAPGTPTYTNIASTSVTVNWTAATGATSYNLQRDTSNTFPAPATINGVTSPYPDAGPLNPNTTYWYRVVAVNASGSTTGAGSSVTTLPTAPGAPGTPTYTNIASTSVTVSWTAATGATSYNLQRATDSAFTLNLATVNGVTSPFAASGLTANTTYWYRVVAVNAGGSTTGAGGSVTTLAPEPRVIPGVPTAAANLCTQITVSAPYTGDANGNSSTSFSRGPSSTGPFTGVTGCGAVTGVSPRSCVDTTVSASTTYYYQVTFTDADGVVGTNPQVTSAVTTPACAALNTTAGTATALVSSCSQLTVSAPFTGDGNGNGNVGVEYNTTNTWPGTPACTVVGPSPRTCLVTNLTASTVYFVRVTYVDADGVVGVNPQVLGPVSTPACAGNGAAPMILFLAPSRNATVGGTETFKVQVHAPNGIVPANILYSLDGGATAAVTVNANYTCGTSCAVYQFTVATTSLTSGAHYATVKATDNSVFVAQLSQPFLVSNSGAVAAGSGHVLRRTSGSQLCLDCHAIATHSSQATSFNYGNWGLECSACHTPHATTNIYLVKPTIDTPNSGSRSVSFQNTTGVAANSFGTPQASGAGVNVCEVCHTKTKNSDASPRARNNVATDWTKHYTGSCTGCHPHGKGFAAGESEGAATCSGCHKSIWDGMTGAVARTTKHTLGNLLGTNDAFGDTAITWGNPLSTNAASARSCVNMCHNDHPHTLTSPVTATHENNVYMDATSQASRTAGVRTSADKDKTDFENGQANGGMCVSCHKNPVDASHPAVVQANFSTSAHNTTSTTPGGAWQFALHDGSNFNRNCTKCHWDAADGTTPAISGKTGIGAVHSNSNPSLLMGTTNPAAAPASFICYRCHGGGTTGADYSSKAVYQDGAKAVKHPMDADTVHASVTEFTNAAWGNTLGVTGRHSNCQDCHDPHEAQKSIKQGTITASTTTTLTDSAMSGRWTASEWVGAILYIPTLAAGQNTRAITASTAAGVLTVAAWSAAPAAGPAYFILDNKADGGLQGAWGAQLSTNPALWTAPASTNFTKRTIVAGTDLQATLCFKCHSSYYWGAGTPPNGLSANGTATTPVETDVAMEFNPNNRSGHPVLVSLNNFAGSTAPKPLAAAQMLAPWNVAVGTQTMSCNDCHNTDAATPAAQGPHGSAASFMLKNGGAKPGWPTASATAAGFATTICSDCHVNANIHGRDNAHAACYLCHIVVPHGGKMSRLIGDRDATSAMPARYAYNNDKNTMNVQSFTKAATDAGYDTPNCQTTCTGTHGTAASENW